MYDCLVVGSGFHGVFFEHQSKTAGNFVLVIE